MERTKVSFVKGNLATEAHVSSAVATSCSGSFKLTLRLTITAKSFRGFIKGDKGSLYGLCVFIPALDPFSKRFLGTADE